jgi:PAS domain S-box-containing protein
MRYVSPSAADLLSMPMESWEGDLEKWLSMMHPDDVERMSTIARDVLTTGGPWNHIFRIIAGDGRIVWLLDRGQALDRDDEGRPSLFQGVLLDVSEEAEVHAALKASEATFRSVVEAMPAVPWTEIVDPATRQGRYSFIGPQTHEIFGYPPSELVTEPGHFFRLVHPDDRTRLAAASDRCDRTGEPWDELYRVIHRDGSVRWILSHARKTADGDRAHWQGVSLDVTRHVADSAFTLPTRETVERS